MKAVGKCLPVLACGFQWCCGKWGICVHGLAPGWEWENAVTVCACQPQTGCRGVLTLPALTDFSKAVGESHGYLYSPVPTREQGISDQLHFHTSARHRDSTMTICLCLSQWGKRWAPCLSVPICTSRVGGKGTNGILQCFGLQRDSWLRCTSSRSPRTANESPQQTVQLLLFQSVLLHWILA